jgi:MOSC domain-containing protein YiiM
MPERTSLLFSWLNSWRRDERRGRLVDIFVAPAAGAPMHRLDAARCLPGRGLEGDRYALGKGHWVKTDGRELTLVTRQDIERANRRGPLSFADGEHRRNLVVDGIRLEVYRGHRVRIGSVEYEFHRLRPPCGYLDRLLQAGAGRALGKGAGIGLRVLQEGVIRVGDPVEVLVDQDRPQQ